MGASAALSSFAKNFFPFLLCFALFLYCCVRLWCEKESENGWLSFLNVDMIEAALCMHSTFCVSQQHQRKREATQQTCIAPKGIRCFFSLEPNAICICDYQWIVFQI